MVFTLGFLSILVFAVVLGNSGSIITAIFDDLVDRSPRLSWLQTPWVMCLAWGVLYYIWMVVLAWMAVDWWQERLGEDLSYSDAYWYRYVRMQLLRSQRSIYLHPQLVLVVVTIH
jgi:hypothetical protein